MLSKPLKKATQSPFVHITSFYLVRIKQIIVVFLWEITGQTANELMEYGGSAALDDPTLVLGFVWNAHEYGT